MQSLPLIYRRALRHSRFLQKATSVDTHGITPFDCGEDTPYSAFEGWESETDDLFHGSAHTYGVAGTQGTSDGPPAQKDSEIAAAQGEHSAGASETVGKLFWKAVYRVPAIIMNNTSTQGFTEIGNPP